MNIEDHATIVRRTKNRAIITLIAAGFLCGCAVYVDETYVLQVTGTENVMFHGNCMTIDAQGNVFSRNFKGVIPNDLEIRGDIISCNFQKLAESGDIHLELLSEEGVISTSSSGSPYGFVTAKVYH
jgi:hypothetical protein